jgi:hypothetical protein
MKQDDQNVRALKFCCIACYKTIRVRLELPFALELVKVVMLQIEFFQAIVQIVQIIQTVVIAIIVKVEIQIVVFKLVL